MKRAIILAVLLAATLAVPATAQEPTRVCTEVVVPDDSPLVGSDQLRGEPPDGACDFVVYLPLILADSSLASALADLAGRDEICATPATLDSAGGDPVACDELE